MSRIAIRVIDCGIVTALGRGKANVAQALFAGSQEGIVLRDNLVPDQSIYIGAVMGDLPALPAALADLDCRNNRLMQVALAEIETAVGNAITRYGRDRVAVIMGTSTSGISDGENALAVYDKTGAWPQTYHYRQQEISSISAFAARYFGVTGAAYTVATACASSTKIFASAKRLIQAGLADAVIVGGTDTICKTTINGFHALELLSKEKCNPFSANRNGINIGEGASAFLLEMGEGGIQLLGTGETSDAHHLTAPDPVGGGACQAMRQALDEAELLPADIAYINLHGTATLLNDAMEAVAVSSVFGADTPCSSTKGMTGHMLGATGGCEAAFLWLTLNPGYNSGLLPPHVWDGVVDPALPALNLVKKGAMLPSASRLAMLSNSFGFGGSNAALIFGKGY